MKGVYSIAEAIDDSNKRPNKTIFCLLSYDGGPSFDNEQWYSLNQVGKMVAMNGGKYFRGLHDVADYLNAN